MSYDLAAAQGLTEPAPEGEPEEQGGGFLKSVGQIFGGQGQYSGPQGVARLHEETAAPATGSLSPAQFGGSGSSGAARPPAELPQNSDRAAQINDHVRGVTASLAGSRRSVLNGRSALDYQRSTFGGPTS
jgi:hypothetical protein